MTKVVTFAIQKGGVGKTTQLYNFAEWLADKGYRTLMIDKDYQGSLSEVYGFHNSEGSSLCMFQEIHENPEEVILRKINPHLFLIPAHAGLEDIPLQMRAKGVQDVNFILENWMYDHEELMESFDFILIDTHPDALTVTANAIAASHVQIGIVEPSEFSFNAIEKSEEVLKRLKQETYDKRRKEHRITTQLYFVANKLRANEQLTQELLHVISENESVIARIPNKTLFDKSTYHRIPLVSQLRDEKVLKIKGNLEFKDRIETEYGKLLTVIQNV